MILNKQKNFPLKNPVKKQKIHNTAFIRAEFVSDQRRYAITPTDFETIFSREIVGIET